VDVALAQLSSDS
jgi:hypothetical protein